MGRIRAQFARWRRAWLPIPALGLAVYGINIANLQWSDESAVGGAWLLFALWAWVFALVTAMTYESSRPLLEDVGRDRVCAFIVHGLASLPLLFLLLITSYAVLLPSDQGLSFEIGEDRFFVVLLVLLLGPSIVSMVLAGGLFLKGTAGKGRQVAYWIAAALVLAFPPLNTLISSGFVYEQGGGLFSTGLMLLMAPVYVGFWKWRPRRSIPEPLYPGMEK